MYYFDNDEFMFHLSHLVSGASSGIDSCAPSRPSTQPNVQQKSHDKLSVEEFLPMDAGKRRPKSPSRSNTPVMENTRSQTMSHYESLDASDHM